MSVKLKKSVAEKGLWKPTNDLVLVEPIDMGMRELESGILIPATNSEDLVSNREGIVRGIGPGSEEMIVDFATDIDIKLGDHVLYEREKGIPVSVKGKDYDFVRGWHMVGKLTDRKVKDMPFIWKGRALEPFADRLFVEWKESKATMLNNQLVKTEVTKAKSIIGKIITMGPAMPKHFKGLGVEVGQDVLFDPFTIQGQMHNWKHENKRYCVIQAKDIMAPVTKALAAAMEFHGETISER